MAGLGAPGADKGPWPSISGSTTKFYGRFRSVDKAVFLLAAFAQLLLETLFLESRSE